MKRLLPLALLALAAPTIASAQPRGGAGSITPAGNPSALIAAESAFARAWEAEMTPEAITGAAGDQAEGGGGADQSGGDLIHGAVATDCDDQIAAIVEGAAG
jgi:hypothetical protein